jgi:alpha-galactosidase/6-phospho-beta-glucosidase family protein
MRFGDHGSNHHRQGRLVPLGANGCSAANAVAVEPVVLHDLDTDRMQRMEDLGSDIARARSDAGAYRARSQAALDSTEFVITAFSVGGFDSMQHDIEIPQQYGIRQPFGDSVGGRSCAARSGRSADIA